MNQQKIIRKIENNKNNLIELKKIIEKEIRKGNQMYHLNLKLKDEILINFQLFIIANIENDILLGTDELEKNDYENRKKNVLMEKQFE